MASDGTGRELAAACHRQRTIRAGSGQAASAATAMDLVHGAGPSYPPAPTPPPPFCSLEEALLLHAPPHPPARTHLEKASPVLAPGPLVQPSCTHPYNAPPHPPAPTHPPGRSRPSGCAGSAGAAPLPAAPPPLPPSSRRCPPRPPPGLLHPPAPPHSPAHTTHVAHRESTHASVRVIYDPCPSAPTSTKSEGFWATVAMRLRCAISSAVPTHLRHVHANDANGAHAADVVLLQHEARAGQGGRQEAQAKLPSHPAKPAHAHAHSSGPGHTARHPSTALFALPGHPAVALEAMHSTAQRVYAAAHVSACSSHSAPAPPPPQPHQPPTAPPHHRRPPAPL